MEELAPLLGAGIDLGEKPGTFLITHQFSKPKKGGSGGAEVEDRTFSIEASSGREAIEKISKVTYRSPFMGSLKVIIIGEDVAKAGGFNDMLDFAQRFSEFRRSMYLVLAKGKAQDILNLKLRSGLLPAMAIKNIIESGDEISSFPTVRLGHYLTILSTKITAPILPMLESVKPGEGIEYKPEGKDEAGEIQIQGAGVLRGDRLVDFLTDEETKGYMWLENNVIHRFINTVDLKENGVKFAGQVLKSTTKYKVKDNNGKIELQYLIKASIAVDEILDLKEQLSEPEWVELVKGAEKSFAKVIEKECESSIKKQRELGLDFLGIGRHIEQRNPAYWKTIKDHWEEEIKNFPISLEVQVTVHHSGMSSSSAVNSTGEGQE
ncbi:Spore germination protein GerKC [Desulfosporosinus sp. I2]|nr:Spore germination protein GerKC [Desulfosporosinus sp. I2]